MKHADLTSPVFESMGSFRAKSLNAQTSVDGTGVGSARINTSNASMGTSVGPEDVKERHATNIAITRALARQMTTAQKDELFKNHHDLALKVALGTASSSERARLQTVRWALDRLQDAELGEGLDMLEMVAATKKELAAQMTELIKTLGQRRPRQGRKGAGKR